MKTVTLFAIIGIVIHIISSLLWIVIRIIGFRNFGEHTIEIISYTSSALVIVAHLLLLIFFVTLFNRQK